MKIFNWVLCGLFALFAIVQYNDIDPWVWIALYGYVSVVSAYAALGRFNQPILILGIIISLIGLGILIPDFYDWVQKGMPTITGSMKAESPHVELTREFLGFVLILITLIFHWWQSRRLEQ